MQRAGSGPAFSPIAAQRPARTSAIDSPRGRRRGTGPGGTLGADLGRLPALVRAVVPLREVGDDLRRRPEARQLARPPRQVEGADEDPREVDPAEPPCEARRIALATLRQGQVGPPGVLPRERPGRLAVPRPRPESCGPPGLPRGGGSRGGASGPRPPTEPRRASHWRPGRGRRSLPRPTGRGARR